MNVDLNDLTWVDPGHEKDIARLAKKKWFTSGGHHESVVVAVDGLIATVDRKLAEAVHLLWRMGVRTRASCEDTIGWRMQQKNMRMAVRPEERARREKEPWAYLVFDDLVLLQKFARLLPDVAVREGDHRWEFAAWPIDEACMLGGTVDFPQAHIPAIVDALRVHVAGVEEYRRLYGPNVTVIRS